MLVWVQEYSVLFSRGYILREISLYFRVAPKLHWGVSWLNFVMNGCIKRRVWHYSGIIYFEYFNVHNKEIIKTSQHRLCEGLFRDPFVNAPSQWKTMLQCNVVSHWLGTLTKWFLQIHLTGSHRIMNNAYKIIFMQFHFLFVQFCFQVNFTM